MPVICLISVAYKVDAAASARPVALSHLGAMLTVVLVLRVTLTFRGVDPSVGTLEMIGSLVVTTKRVSIMSASTLSSWDVMIPSVSLMTTARRMSVSADVVEMP